MRVLCIDDDPVTIQLLSTVLPDHFEGIEIRTAGSVAEGKARLDKEQIDTVLCDLMLADGTGLEILEYKEKLPYNVDVIMLTSHGSVESAVQAMVAGAYDYLEKPVDFDILRIRLESLCSFQSRREEAEEYRYAKEVVEATADRETHALEWRFSKVKRSIREVLALLENPGNLTVEDLVAKLQKTLLPILEDDSSLHE